MIAFGAPPEFEVVRERHVDTHDAARDGAYYTTRTFGQCEVFGDVAPLTRFGFRLIHFAPPEDEADGAGVGAAYAPFEHLEISTPIDFAARS